MSKYLTRQLLLLFYLTMVTQIGAISVTLATARWRFEHCCPEPSTYGTLIEQNRTSVMEEPSTLLRHLNVCKLLSWIKAHWNCIHFGVLHILAKWRYQHLAWCQYFREFFQVLNFQCQNVVCYSIYSFIGKKKLHIKFNKFIVLSHHTSSI